VADAVLEDAGTASSSPLGMNNGREGWAGGKSIFPPLVLHVGVGVEGETSAARTPGIGKPGRE
jgi:hypothetical protein